jgi:hypothetical protein
MSGANPAAVQRIMRHTDPRITTETYGHLTPATCGWKWIGSPSDYPLTWQAGRTPGPQGLVALGPQGAAPFAASLL